jgi:hypothetical protein
MKLVLVPFVLCAAFVVTADAGEAYGRFFTDSTMRVDFYHSGTKTTEVFSLDQVIPDGPWAGSRVNLLDTLNLGEFLVRVYDRASTALIFSRGYSTVFNEWQTTDEATHGIWRSFSESVRFPYPRRAVQMTISRRDKSMDFRELWSVIIDPSDPTQVRKDHRRGTDRVLPIMKNGDPTSKVDIVILGDGYGKGDLEKLRQDARHFNEVMFSTEPFKRRASDFNVWLVETISGSSGIDIPDKGTWRDNALGCEYNTFGSPRYVLTVENKAVRDAASAAPYDFICILVNDTRYGGGGIYNLYTTTYTGEKGTEKKWWMDYVYVHEFGHSFGGLGDEYYSSSTGYTDFYPPGVEPWEPNVTALHDPKNVKWKALVTPGIEIPTPWEKSLYDSVASARQALDRLAPDYYQEQKPLHDRMQEILRTSAYAGKVGAFEGAGYSSTGLYRPAIDCRMFSLSLVDFDPVCRASIERVVSFYAR